MLATANEPTRAERITQLSAEIAPLEEKRQRLRTQRTEAAEILARMQERLIEGKLGPEKLTEAQGKLGVLDDALQTVSRQLAPLIGERCALEAAERAAVEREAILHGLVELAESGKKYHAELLAARAFILSAIRKGVQRYEAASAALEAARREFAAAADSVQRGVVDRRYNTTAEEHEAAVALLEELEERTDMTGIYAAASLTPGMILQRDRSTPGVESRTGLSEEDYAVLRAVLPEHR